jgi:hypothetical protein
VARNLTRGKVALTGESLMELRLDVPSLIPEFFELVCTIKGAVDESAEQVGQEVTNPHQDY